MSNQRKRLNEEERDEDDEEEGIGEWERAYVDDKSWEGLEEDESGLLRPIDNSAIYHAQYRRRLRMLSAAAAGTRIQKGLIRYLCIVIDFSQAAAEIDFRPSRMAIMARHLEAFIREFFDQNPLSQISLVSTKNGVAHTLTDLGGSPESHINAVMGKLEASGNASLQNALELVHEQLNQVHLKDLLLEHAPPPPAIAEFAIANLIKMGFPQRAAEGSMAICSCHKEVQIGTGYMCPRCKARVCDLPTECAICGLTLVSSPHLARSYHHLFPIAPFDEVPALLTLNDPRRKFEKSCFGCQQSLFGAAGNNKPGPCVTCRKCKHYFCLDCDIYIHESLHNCPGCESTNRPKSVSLMEE